MFTNFVIFSFFNYPVHNMFKLISTKRIHRINLLSNKNKTRIINRKTNIYVPKFINSNNSFNKIRFYSSTPEVNGKEVSDRKLTENETTLNEQNELIALTSSDLNLADSSRSFLDSEPLNRLLDGQFSGITEPILLSGQFVIDFIHLSTGMPWWGVLATYGAIIRLVSIPIAIKQSQIAKKIEIIREEVTAIRNELMEDQTLSLKDFRLILTQKTKEVFDKHGVGQFQLLRYLSLRILIAAQAFFAINRMSKDITMPHIFNGLQNGGLFWFKDLTALDPLYILPFLTIATSLFQATEMFKNRPVFLERKHLIVLYTLMFGFAYFILCSLPVSIHIFIIGTNVATAITSFILKRFFNIHA